MFNQLNITGPQKGNQGYFEPRWIKASTAILSRGHPSTHLAAWVTPWRASTSAPGPLKEFALALPTAASAFAVRAREQIPSWLTPASGSRTRPGIPTLEFAYTQSPGIVNKRGIFSDKKLTKTE